MNEGVIVMMVVFFCFWVGGDTWSGVWGVGPTSYVRGVGADRQDETRQEGRREGRTLTPWRQERSLPTSSVGDTSSSTPLPAMVSTPTC